MNSSQDEDAATIFQERSNFVQVKKKDVEFLKKEYKQTRKQQFRFEAEKNKDYYLWYKGIARGLETALIQLGVTNDEFDRLSREAYEEVMDKKACEEHGFNQDGTEMKG